MKEKKEKQVKNKEKETSKEKFGTKFINTIKKRWLISGTNTLLLIAILVAIVILINSMVQSFDITPIDCTSNKEYTLTNESKDRLKNIDKTINVYLVGYEETDTQTSLAKQYNKSNKNINVEVIDATQRTDIASKYNVTNDNKAIIIENGEKSKTLYSDDLYTYDSSYQTIDLTEEKITSAILNVTSDKIANVYFLSGYSNYSLEYSGGMYYLSSYLKDEVLNYNTLNMLVSGSIPEDCDTLVITTPNKDFDELTTNEITKYINNGGNILWLNSSYSEKIDMPNVNKILALYGINPFEVGYVYETDSNKTALGYPMCMVQSLGSTDVANKLTEAVLLNSTKINVNTEELENLGVTEEPIISTSDTSYFRSNIQNTSSSTNGDEQGGFTIGGIFTKTLKTENEESAANTENAENSENTENSEEAKTSEENSEDNTKKSTLVIFGDNNFTSDIQITSQVSPMLFLANNKDLMLNSIAYLTDNDEDITIRKDYQKTSDFTPTDGQKSTIMKIVFAVPVAVIIAGIVVWQIRRRRK